MLILLSWGETESGFSGFMSLHSLKTVAGLTLENELLYIEFVTVALMNTFVTYFNSLCSQYYI